MPKTIFTGANVAAVEVIRKARVHAGLTQAELARRIGRDQSHISLIENSQRRLDLVEFREIALALSLDPLGLFKQVSDAIAAVPSPKDRS